MHLRYGHHGLAPPCASPPGLYVDTSAILPGIQRVAAQNALGPGRSIPSGPKRFLAPLWRGAVRTADRGPGRRAPTVADAPRRSTSPSGLAGNGPGRGSHGYAGRSRCPCGFGPGPVSGMRKPLGACAPRGFLYVWCGGVLLSHTLSGAVPSPCQALASGFGMGPGVSPGPWPPQIFSYTVGNNVPPACGGLGTGQRTRICRCFVLWPDNAHCRLVSFAGGRCGPTARGWNVSVAFRPLVPVGSTPRGASTSGLSTTCSAWGLQELEGSTECLSWSRLPA